MTFIVLPAYNAAATLSATINSLPKKNEYKVLLCDDDSSDNTIVVAKNLGINIIAHSKNLGYGANQKTLYNQALSQGADIIVMLHPDNQYDGEVVPKMVQLIQSGQADFVLGNRMFGKSARNGGMPWWKRLANHSLSALQRYCYNIKLGEFHTGLRAYKKQVLEQINFMGFSDDFVFDSEMIAAAIAHGFKLAEIPTPTRYFDKASSINLRRSIIYGLATLNVLWRFKNGYYKSPNK